MSRATQGSAALRMASCTGLSPSVERLSRRFHSPCFLRYRGPTTPFRPQPEGFGLFPVRSPLLGESLLFSLPAGTKMFQFPAFASPIRGMTGLQPAGLSHSEIRGSKDICSYPRLFAACHVLHRLQEPRHPPYALSYLLTAPCRHGVSACSCTSIAWFCSGTCSIAARPWILNLVVQYVKDRSPVKGGVENIGVEPMTSCMPCKRSSQLS